MRILHVAHSFPPESHGGTETYVCDLAIAQRRRGDDVAVLSGSERPDRAESCTREDFGELQVWRLRPPERGIASLVGVDARVRGDLESLLGRLRPELVHLHHWHNLTSDAIATCRRAGCATVVSLHDLWITCPLFFRLPDGREICPPSLEVAECVRCISRFVSEPAGMLEARFAKRAERLAEELSQAGAVLALSETQRSFLAAIEALRGLDLATVPLPAPEVAPVPRVGSRPVEPGRLHVASWGGLDPGKGMLTLVEAAERMREPGRVTIHHHGRVLDAAFRETLIRAAARVELELHGPFTPESLAAALGGYDVAVFPSLYLETHGFVVDEALGLGLPVLVSDRGAPKERIGGRGRVFAATDRAALAALLDECATGSLLAEMAASPPLPVVRMSEHLARLDAAYARATATTRTGSATLDRSPPRRRRIR